MIGALHPFCISPPKLLPLSLFHLLFPRFPGFFFPASFPGITISIFNKSSKYSFHHAIIFSSFPNILPLCTCFYIILPFRTIVSLLHKFLEFSFSFLVVIFFVSILQLDLSYLFHQFYFWFFSLPLLLTLLLFSCRFSIDLLVVYCLSFLSCSNLFITLFHFLTLWFIIILSNPILTVFSVYLCLFPPHSFHSLSLNNLHVLYFFNLVLFHSNPFSPLPLPYFFWLFHFIHNLVPLPYLIIYCYPAKSNPFNFSR